MRLLTLMLIGGLVLALGVPASAITFSQPWSGPIVMHANNVAMGATYTGDVKVGGVTQPAFDGSKWYNFSTSAYDLNASPLYNPANLVANPATGAKPGENGWGLVQIDTIYAGSNAGGNNITQLGIKLWETGMFETELVATYFNRQDLGVQFLSTNYADQYFEYNNDTFSIWEQPAGTIGIKLGAAGSGEASGGAAGTGRLKSSGVPIDKYVGVGYDSAGVQLAGATLVLSGVGEIGYFGSLANTTGTATFNVQGGTGSGVADQFYSVTGGTQQIIFDTDFFTPTKVVGNAADIRIHVTDSPILLRTPATYDWLTSSSDPLTAAAVPEPLTMASLLLGIGCLSRYVRKRR